MGAFQRIGAVALAEILDLLPLSIEERPAGGIPREVAPFAVDHEATLPAVERPDRAGAFAHWPVSHRPATGQPQQFSLRAGLPSIDQLHDADPDLGRKFSAVNRDLEELTKSVPPSHKLSMDDGVMDDDLRAVDPFGCLLLKQRNLLKERAKLISQIQSLPGFDGFLAFPSFGNRNSCRLPAKGLARLSRRLTTARPISDGHLHCDRRLTSALHRVAFGFDPAEEFALMPSKGY